MGEPLFCSTMILKSRLACSTGKFLPGPEPLLVAAELSLTPLLWDESEHTEADSGWFDGSLLVLLLIECWINFFFLMGGTSVHVNIATAIVVFYLLLLQVLIGKSALMLRLCLMAFYARSRDF